MHDIDVVVSDKVNTFLLLSFYKGRKFKRDEQLKDIEKHIYEEIERWKGIYRNRLVEVYGWDPDDPRIEELCGQKLIFKTVDTNGKEEDHEKHLNFSFPLLGRHDLIFLLEGPNLVEMSSILYYVNRKLQSEKLIADSLNMSAVPMDFLEDGKFFLKEKKRWFLEDERSNSPKTIEIFEDRVYAIVCVEFNKGMEKGSRYIELPDFLRRLGKLRKNSRNLIKGIFLGFGLHEIIIILESKEVSEIIVTVADLRMAYRCEEAQGILRDTSTIFCIPRRESRSPPVEDHAIEYSTLLSIAAGRDMEVFKSIKDLGEDKRIRRYLIEDRNKEIIKVFERQGYYDLIVSFKPRSHFDAAKFTTRLYEIDGVLKISTLIKMDEEKVERKLRTWRGEGGDFQ